MVTLENPALGDVTLRRSSTCFETPLIASLFEAPQHDVLDRLEGWVFRVTFL